MRTRMLAVLLPVAAAVALAGTGFGAWIFAGTVNSAVTGANIELTDAYGYDGLGVNWTTDKKTLKLNQDSTDRTKGAAISDLEFTVSYTAQVEKGGKGTYTEGDTDDKDSYSFKETESLAVAFGYTITVAYNTKSTTNSYTLDHYVTPTFSVAKASSATATYTDPSLASNTVTETVSASGVVADTITVKFAWVDANVPQNVTAYDELKSILNQKTAPMTITIAMTKLS